MSEVTNLRRFRKAKARAEKRAKSAERTAPPAPVEAARNALTHRRLEGKKLGPAPQDGSDAPDD